MADKKRVTPTKLLWIDLEMTGLDSANDRIVELAAIVTDWNFMELCGYAATLENGSEEIKRFVKTKGEGRFFIAPHVDENGVLAIFKYFSL